MNYPRYHRGLQELFCKNVTISGYDIIGDVHGCAETLKKLLTKLQYKLDGNTFWHADRQAIFVGDIVDRGPRIREALHLIKHMVDAGTAQCIMGNHEYNALGYTTLKTPELEQGTKPAYVREHNRQHNRQIAETLAQFASYPEEWRMFLDWFVTLPVFLEMPGFRVVHACWDEALINEYKTRYQTNTVTLEFIRRSADKDTFAGRFMDRLTRGTDMRLPEGRIIRGKDGCERAIFRTKFWAREPQKYRDIVFQPDPLPEDLVERELSDDEKASLLTYSADAPPVFIGHYWLHGKPKPLTPNIACLDYSAVKYGRLVSYRFDGEQQLDESKFEWVYVDSGSV